MKTKYVIKITSQFKRDYRKAQKRGLPTELLKEIVGLLAMGEPLPAKNKDHMLTGIWAGYHECHVQPNWLLIYLIEDENLILTLTRTGIHSDLFGSRK